MNEQIGWRGLVERVKNEAPRYAQLLPELPRLLHHSLRASSHADEARALRELVIEQRRTNRLLQAVVWTGVGFGLGALGMQLLQML